MTLVKVNTGEVKLEIMKHEQEWLQKLFDEYPLYKNISQIDRIVYLHGEWLGKRLESAGIDKVTRNNICFAFGQRAAMKRNQITEVVVEVWNRFVDGDVDTPGLELANRLIEDDWPEGSNVDADDPILELGRKF